MVAQLGAGSAFAANAASYLFLAADGMIALAVAPHHRIVIELIGAVLIGFGWEFVFVGGQTTVAIEVPDKVRGRAMGLFFVLVTATTALGAVALGASINSLGVMIAFLAAAAVVVVTAAVLLVMERPSAASRHEHEEPVAQNRL
jgi:MFS family permease